MIALIFKCSGSRRSAATLGVATLALAAKTHVVITIWRQNLTLELCQSFVRAGQQKLPLTRCNRLVSSAFQLT